MVNHIKSASVSAVAGKPRLPTRAMMTVGVASLGIEAIAAATKAIEIFDEFCCLHCPETAENAGFIDIAGKEVFFKFEYCDDNMSIISAEINHPAVTQRVVTFILSNEN